MGANQYYQPYRTNCFLPIRFLVGSLTACITILVIHLNHTYRYIQFLYYFDKLHKPHNLLRNNYLHPLSGFYFHPAPLFPFNPEFKN